MVTETSRWTAACSSSHKFHLCVIGLWPPSCQNSIEKPFTPLDLFLSKLFKWETSSSPPPFNFCDGALPSSSAGFGLCFATKRRSDVLTRPHLIFTCDVHVFLFAYCWHQHSLAARAAHLRKLTKARYSFQIQSVIPLGYISATSDNNSTGSRIKPDLSGRVFLAPIPPGSTFISALRLNQS